MPGLPDVPWTKAVLCLIITVLVTGVLSLNGPNVCMVKQKYNITKLVKYRAPMSIRTYEWCFSMPPRCSKWNTEMRDMTKLETEERTAEVAVCCPGYKMRDVSCVPICPNGKTGPRCSEDCPKNKWGPNCVNECKQCNHGSCSPVTGECWCEDGWQGESCESSMPTTTIENLLTTTKITPTIAPTTKTTIASTDKVQPNINTASTTSTITSSISTTESNPVTEKTITKETIAPIEMKMLTRTSLKPTEKIFRTVTEITNSIFPASTVVRNTTLQNTKQEDKEIITINPEVIQDTTTVSFRNQTSDKDAIISDAAYTNSSKNLMNIESTVYVKSDTNNKVPMTDVVLLENNLENNRIETTTELTIDNRTQSTAETTAKTVELQRDKEIPVEIITTTIENKSPSNFTQDLRISTLETTVIFTTTEETKPTTISELSVIKTTQKKESTTRVETTTRVPSTTVKFKPKEIWIKPAQKGDSVELKSKNNELQRNKLTNKESSIITTPKTIIVSIIPTSVSYATFKKIALTTSAYLPVKMNNALKNSNKIEQSSIKQIPTYLTTTSSATEIRTTFMNTTLTPSTKFISILPITENTTAFVPINSVTSESIKTKSMTDAVTSNNFTISTNTATKLLTTTSKPMETTKATKPVKNYHWITAKDSFKTNKSLHPKLEVSINKTVTAKVATNINKSSANTKMTTEAPSDEETFYILTEPEHITAVMGDKESDRTSMDLKSVISIAGGVMMAVITVAVVIVMIERCKRPRYEDVRKINDIRMQVMIDENDVPPPYVRSIFHTPLPEPPMPEKCHYQPISTLDRNLKQFMRPVVVQAISPIMLENFRGILECHYDHLPRRSHDFQPIPVRCSVTPSFDCCELAPLRGNSATDHDINSMKREAKLDEIDSTTAEPLYAEIPCWRPPSEHAIEILNLNGEAVTEL